MTSHSKWQTARIKQHGLTLVEIMIAITISVVLLAGVGKIFVSSKHTYRVQDALSRVQENGRFAADFLTRSIRMAGYSGCNNISNPVNMVDLDHDGTADPFSEFTTDALIGLEYTDLPIALTSTVSLTAAEVEPDTDVIILMNASPDENVTLVGNLTVSNANVQLDPAAAGLYQADDVLIVSDCESTDVFAAANISTGSKITIAHSSTNNTGNFLSKTYGEDAVVLRLTKTAYYIATNARGNPALFRKRLDHGTTMITEELAEGIEDMQFQYGEDVNGDGVANRYVDADAAGIDMSRIVSVRLGLLVHTVEDKIATEPQTYTFTGQTTTPADQRLRREFYTVIKLRNRGIL
jgi:type IV pilus assembly protein PilW